MKQRYVPAGYKSWMKGWKNLTPSVKDLEEVNLGREMNNSYSNFIGGHFQDIKNNGVVFTIVFYQSHVFILWKTEYWNVFEKKSLSFENVSLELFSRGNC